LIADYARKYERKYGNRIHTIPSSKFPYAEYAVKNAKHVKEYAEHAKKMCKKICQYGNMAIWQYTEVTHTLQYAKYAK
jgi:hypothetical protein